MKNLIIGLLVTGLIVTGYIALTSTVKMKWEGREGKTESVIRGDLTIPINATGEVRSARRVELKSEASGEVIEIAKKPGERVRAGDLLIRLERKEERRNVDKAKIDVRSAKARLKEAELRLELAKGAEYETAVSAAAQAQQGLRLAVFRKEKLEKLAAHQTNEEELLTRDVSYRREKASLEQAEANVAKAQLAIPLAEQTVTQADANLRRFENVLQDAEERFEETDIIAPIEGIVGSIQVEIGDVIQGGKTTFTGGTVLASVLDMSRLRVGAEVDESDIERVRELAPIWAIPGRESDVKLPEDMVAASKGFEHLPVINVESFQGEDFTGVIELIHPESKSVSGVVTYQVDVLIISDNRDLLLPGMRADVRFTSQHMDDILLCPNEAIKQGRNNELGVYIPEENVHTGKPEATFVPCTFGISNGRYSEVTCDELSENDLVYTKLPMKRNRDG